jgi:hypothetical protein
MWLRRAFYYAQFWAIPVLPLWLLVGRGIAIDGAGWELLVLLFATPALTVGLIVVMGLTVARKAVRRARLLSWVDVDVLAAWYLAIIAGALVASPVIAVVVLALTLVAFWSAVWQLVVETRHRVNAALVGFSVVVPPRY